MTHGLFACSKPKNALLTALHDDLMAVLKAAHAVFSKGLTIILSGGGDIQAFIEIQ
jgi:hypothetical protein